MDVSRKKVFLYEIKGLKQCVCTILEATLGRRNSLSPTATRVYVPLSLIRFCQIVPIIHFFPTLFLCKNSLL